MIIGCKFFCHPVGDGDTDGQAIMAHHFAKAIESRRLHLEIAHTPTLVVEGFNFAVVLWVGKVHSKSAALGTIKTWSRRCQALIVALRQTVKQFF